MRHQDLEAETPPNNDAHLIGRHQLKQHSESVSHNEQVSNSLIQKTSF